MKPSGTQLVTTLFLLLGTLTQASIAATIFQDDFSVDGNLNGMMPDTGGAWSVTSGTFTVAGSGVDTAGSNSGSSDTAFGTFTQALQAGETLTLSFTTTDTAGNFASNGWAGISLYTGGSEQVFIGSTGNTLEWGIGGSAIGGTQTFTPAVTAESQTVTFVYIFNSGAWTLNVGGQEINGSATASRSIDRVRIGADINNLADIAVTGISVDNSGSNAAPTATSLTLTGTAVMGSGLTGGYTYNDADGDLEDTGATGTGYRFVRSTDNSVATAGDNTDVATGTTGGDSDSYTLVGADIGNYLFYCVTPRALVGISPGTESCSSASGPVEDADGVSSAVEDAGPNGGDANGDGTPDSQQNDVTSLPSATGSGYLSMEVSGGCSINQNVAAVLPPAPDPEFTYPQGLLEFTLPCETATVTVYYHGEASLNRYSYRKYGPTPPGFGASSWYTLSDAAFGTASVGGQTVATATFTLADAQLGDDTGDDGVIVDQGGPGQRVVPIPTLSQWTLILLIAALGLFASIGLRRRFD